VPPCPSAAIWKPAAAYCPNRMTVAFKASSGSVATSLFPRSPRRTASLPLGDQSWRGRACPPPRSLSTTAQFCLFLRRSPSHRRRTHRAVEQNPFIPPAIVVVMAIPPELTKAISPRLTIVPTRVLPLDTQYLPPLRAVVSMAVPRDNSRYTPAVLVETAVPPS
jgi:hypothetical protein